MQGLVQLGSGVHFGNQLTDAVDQDVFVMDRRKAEDAGSNGYFYAVVIVFLYAPIWFGRKREYRMLHRSHVVFGNGVRDVADKEILDRVTIREEGGSI